MPSYRQLFSLYSRKVNGRRIYYYRTYAPDGTRTTGKSTGETTKTKATLYCQNLYKEGRLVSGKSLMFGAYAQDWFEWGKCAYLKDRLASGTKTKQAITQGYAKILNVALRLYILPYFEKVKLDSITPAKIKAWRIWLQEEKRIANRTINNAAGALKIMTDWALNENLIMYDPFRSIKPMLKDDNKREAFTLDEAKAILQKVWPEHLAWLYSLTAALTGMRQAEIRAIRKETTFPTYIDVSHQYTREGLAPLKNKEKRKVPIPHGLYVLLENLRGNKEFTFQLPDQKEPVGRHYVTYRLDMALPPTILAQKEKRGLCFHSWRHFFNTFLRAENVSDAKIMAVMGHSSGKGSMTDNYTSWTPELYPEVYAAQEKLWEVINTKCN